MKKILIAFALLIVPSSALALGVGDVFLGDDQVTYKLTSDGVYYGNEIWTSDKVTYPAYASTYIYDYTDTLETDFLIYANTVSVWLYVYSHQMTGDGKTWFYTKRLASIVPTSAPVTWPPSVSPDDTQRGIAPTNCNDQGFVGEEL